MAMYRAEIKVIRRSKGKCIVASAAYRAGAMLEYVNSKDKHLVFDYRRRGGVDYSKVILPGGGTADRSALWVGVENHHKREKAVLGNEIIVALPPELSERARTDLAVKYATQISEKYGVAVDVAIHEPHYYDEEQLEADPDKPYMKDASGAKHNGNWHAHILISACHCDKDMKFGKKVIEFDQIACSRTKPKTPNFAEVQRPIWERFVNETLAAENIGIRLDHRSYEAQGIDKKPQHKVGPAATALSRGRKNKNGEMIRFPRKTERFKRIEESIALEEARWYDEYLAYCETENSDYELSRIEEEEKRRLFDVGYEEFCRDANRQEVIDERKRKEKKFADEEAKRKARYLADLEANRIETENKAKAAKKKQIEEFIAVAYRCYACFEGVQSGTTYAPRDMHKVVKDGITYYCRNGSTAPVFAETDDRIYFLESNKSSIAQGVALSLAKFGEEFRLFGPLQFKILAAAEAAKQGGRAANPELQDLHAVALFKAGRGERPDAETYARLRLQFEEAGFSTSQIEDPAPEPQVPPLQPRKSSGQKMGS